MNNQSKELIVVTIPRSSSGLGRYVADAFEKSGCTTRVLDPLASKAHKLFPVLKSISFNREQMWRRRWENELFSSWAWDRNTKHIGKIMDRMARENTRILQVGKDYYPHPNYKKIDYYIFIHTNMKLNLKEGIKPWVPPKHDVTSFLDRETDLYLNARHIFVGGNHVVKSLVEDYGINPHQVSIVGGGVNDYYKLNMSNSPPDTFAYTMIFVGWDFGMKGGPDLIKAFNHVRKKIPQLKLLIVGPTMAVQPAVAGIEYTGPITDNKTLLALYRKSDLFVMPSLCDSFGFVFLEAMSQGLPCIGTNVNAMPEIIEHGKTGYIVPLRNPEALAEAIIKYYSNTSNRRVMGECAIKRIKSFYTWDVVIQKMTRIIWPSE